MRQVITIHTDGRVSGLQRKEGEGLDLRKLGHASIKRASEVLWDEVQQKWSVKITLGKYAGKYITKTMQYAISCRTCFIDEDFEETAMLFNEYDEAVSAEIMVLDHIRMTEGPTALQ